MPGREAIRFIKTTFTGYTRRSVKDIFGASVLVLAAHPDDECVAAGALFRHLEKVRFAHLTDGAPGNLVDARSRGFTTAAEYAEARRSELISALSLAGVGPECCVSAGIADQEASWRLVEAAEWAREAILEFAPETILTLSYEGGHPDHDAVSFAAHAAAALLRGRGGAPPPIIECALYHAGGPGTMASFGFLPRGDVEPITFILTEEERRLKKKMLERFATQSGVLRHFTVEEESFRPAPRYDYTLPPHDGKLFYESFEWGIGGREWRVQAKAALGSLGLKGPI